MVAVEDLAQFCDRWLAAWTGNRPQELIEFYDDQAYYADPARPMGLQGRDQILPYFQRLLAKNPAWVWRRRELWATPKGFVLLWDAQIPTSEGSSVSIRGVDVVEVEGGRIRRNEVFFDRSALLAGPGGGRATPGPAPGGLASRTPFS